MDCAGNDIQAFFNVSLDQCKEHAKTRIQDAVVLL